MDTFETYHRVAVDLPAPCRRLKLLGEDIWGSVVDDGDAEPPSTTAGDSAFGRPVPASASAGRSAPVSFLVE
jgi:hypothetical protein